VVDENKQLLGVFTDGDLRRALDKDINVKTTPIQEAMTQGGVVAKSGMLAAQAAQLMESHKITGLVVCDEKNRIVGALNIHDLFHAGVV